MAKRRQRRDRPAVWSYGDMAVIAGGHAPFQSIWAAQTCRAIGENYASENRVILTIDRL